MNIRWSMKDHWIFTNGKHYTIREYPVVNEGSQIARILAMPMEEAKQYEAVQLSALSQRNGEVLQ